MAITSTKSIPIPNQQPNPSLSLSFPQQPNSETNCSEYEKCRQERINENRQRLLNLGILDLSLNLKSTKPSPRNHSHSHKQQQTPLNFPSLPLPPSRRSSRLQNVTPVTYAEPKEEKVEKRGRRKDIVLEEGAKPEFYGEEHDKLLGNTEKPWTFFVDGYAQDGTRIYDPLIGKTCHQCRQKTLGLRTRCSNCTLVQGQFCGDCLYMRYGEHVEEAMQNPDWLCPGCRGICNCSLCRKAKGWAPTGALYKKISSLGFKSVAHFLIATKRTPPALDIEINSPQSAKRALPFENVEPDNASEQELSLNDKESFEKTENSPKSVQEFHLDDKAAAASTEIGTQSGQELNLADKAVVQKTETNPGYGNAAISVGELNQSSANVGKSRKRRKKENADDRKESLESNRSAQVEPITDMNVPNPSASKSDSIARRLRPRNKT